MGNIKPNKFIAFGLKLSGSLLTLILIPCGTIQCIYDESLPAPCWFHQQSWELSGWHDLLMSSSGSGFHWAGRCWKSEWLPASCVKSCSSPGWTSSSTLFCRWPCQVTCLSTTRLIASPVQLIGIQTFPPKEYLQWPREWSSLHKWRCQYADQYHQPQTRGWWAVSWCLPFWWTLQWILFMNTYGWPGYLCRSQGKLPLPTFHML